MRRTRVIAALAVGALAAALLAACGGEPAGHAPTPRIVPAAGTTLPNWATYHRDRVRSGYDPSVPHVVGPLRKVWSVPLDGAVYAEPLVVNDVAVVATENNTLYGVRGGRILWRHHIGTPAPQSALPCGNIFPLGITGTPVYDTATQRVFAVAELANPVRHVLVAVSPGNGALAWTRSVDPSGMSPAYQQQRAALALGNGRVYVAFGGLAGDCGPYHGYVVGMPTSGRGSALVYRTPSAREAGIWAPPGPSLDASGNLFVSTGNGAATTPPYDYSDSIVKLRPSDLRMTSYFAPSSWASENANDVDLGSQGPTLAGTWVFAAGKSGTAYVLHGSALGGVGGQASGGSLCQSFGGTAYVGGVVYVPCTDGLRAVQISSSGAMRVLWHTSSTITGSPVVGGGAVWSLDTRSGVLYELRPSNGTVATSVSVGPVTRFTTPTLHGKGVFVGTKNGLVAYWSS